MLGYGVTQLPAVWRENRKTPLARQINVFFHKPANGDKVRHCFFINKNLSKGKGNVAFAGRFFIG